MKNHIKSKNIVADSLDLISDFVKNWDNNYMSLSNFFNNVFNISSTVDKDIIDSYKFDWSNLPANASILTRPKSIKECSIILKTCYKCNIPITVSAGRTNLTGSATPEEGIILSTVLLTEPEIELDINNKHVLSSIGIPLEVLRNKILELSNQNLFYPVNPTSRNDAFVGGTLSCNASGFIPGDKGATRYWVKEIELLLPNGNYLLISRGQSISIGSKFFLEDDNDIIELPIPNYRRPKIKNASGPFSSDKGEIDLIDLIIGSEGIFGLIVSCKLNLLARPKKHLDLFLKLESENQAIDLYHYLYNKFKKDMSRVFALEYFGYNCQKYMNHKDFLFNSNNQVGLYIKVPIYNSTINDKSFEWFEILKSFDKNIKAKDVIVLNDKKNMELFFEARHSIPDNALIKTKELGGISIITDTIVPPENYKKYLSKVHHLLESEEIEYLLFGHLGDCHLHFHLIPEKNQEQKAITIYNLLVDYASELGGVYSAEHGTGKRKRLDFKKCYGEEAVQMISNLKSKLDPNFLLNRGNVIAYDH